MYVGPAQRDVTPEATERVCEKLLDGFGELMRSTSLKVRTICLMCSFINRFLFNDNLWLCLFSFVAIQYVPTAILSRQVAGTRGSSLIINCPGKLLL